MKTNERKDNRNEKKDHVFVFQGGGQYFFWNMGVAAYLKEHFAITDIKVVGASAGALTAVLMVCGVDAEKARKCAVQLCDETKVWDRWQKFIGIWGDMVGVWLDRLLPDNAADLCNNRVHILVSQLFGFKKVVSTFATRQELIQCLRASTHIPFLMDYRPFYWFQGWWCYDGCIGNITNKPYKVLDEKTNTHHFFCYQDDGHTIFQGWPTNPDMDIARLVEDGFQYAKRLHATNRLPIKPPHRLDTPDPDISYDHGGLVGYRRSNPRLGP